MWYNRLTVQVGFMGKLVQPLKIFLSLISIQYNTMKKTIAILTLLLISSTFIAQQFTISGNITDQSSGEELLGATVLVSSLMKGTAANSYGFYSLTLDAGTYDLKFTSMGYQSKTIKIVLDSDQKLDVEMASVNQQISKATVIGKKPAVENIESVEMSKVQMNMATIKKIPAFMGEVDVIKAIQLLPGVATVGEGTSGFYVRGGAVDQNLILLDEAPVYNASHVLGFFSVFNSEAIKDVQLYKGGIPSRYGGRLASVLDVRMKEGNLKEFHASGGVGTVASRLTLEMPIVKDKGSILISGRRTYVDLFLKLSKNEGLRNTSLYFYDTNLKANYKLGENDRIYLSGYFGKDVQGLSDLFNINWGNTTGTLRWNHFYNPKLFSNVTFVYSDYDYFLGAEQTGVGFKWDSEIKDYSLKADYSYFHNINNKIQFGAIATMHNLSPGYARGSGENNALNEINLPKNRGLEYGAYVSNEQSIGEKIKVIYGLRYSLFQNVGEGVLWNYDSDYNPTDSVDIAKWDTYNTKGNFEPRIGVNYKLNERSSIKASYNRTAQYMQLASNSTSSSPLDVWFLSSPNVKPQLADQVAAGYFRNFKDNTIEASVEVYYKTMQNAIDFVDRAELLLNEHLEGELRIGDARSYGLELMVRKSSGKLTGILSYTLARSEKFIPEIFNDWYPTKYDKTHDIAATASYAFNKRISASVNFVYGTGSAITLPAGRFEFMGSETPIFTEKNGGRMPSYHRADVSVNWRTKKNMDKKFEIEHVISVYNAYNRANPYSINFRERDTGERYAEMTYLLPIIPAYTLNFKF